MERQKILTNDVTNKESIYKIYKQGSNLRRFPTPEPE